MRTYISKYSYLIIDYIFKESLIMEGDINSQPQNITHFIHSSLTSHMTTLDAIFYLALVSLIAYTIYCCYRIHIIDQCRHKKYSHMMNPRLYR